MAILYFFISKKGVLKQLPEGHGLRIRPISSKRRGEFMREEGLEFLPECLCIISESLSDPDLLEILSNFHKRGIKPTKVALKYGRERIIYL